MLETMDLVKKEARKYSYCVKCWSAQYFKLANNIWVCEECSTPMKRAKDIGTIVTQEVMNGASMS